MLPQLGGGGIQSSVGTEVSLAVTRCHNKASPLKDCNPSDNLIKRIASMNA